MLGRISFLMLSHNVVVFLQLENVIRITMLRTPLK